jgi:hypothetical protein
MTPEIDEKFAREVLGDAIQPNGLYDLSSYMSWQPGDRTITLDGDFTVSELEAIAWWMRNKG